LLKLLRTLEGRLDSDGLFFVPVEEAEGKVAGNLLDAKDGTSVGLT
jgi:hypothetical protein